MRYFIILITFTLAGCSAGIGPALDAELLPDAAADGSTPDVDGGVVADAGNVDADALVADAGTDAGDVDAGSPDAGDPVDAGDVCTSLADGCAGMFTFPADDDVVMTGAGGFMFGSIGDYDESRPQVLPAVLIARHLDITDIYVTTSGGASPCGRLPEFRVLVNGVEVGRFTPDLRVDTAVHYDFATPIRGTVFTVRIEETTAWCGNYLRVLAGTSHIAVAALAAP